MTGGHHSPHSAEDRRRMVELGRSGRRPEEPARECEPSAQRTRALVGQSDPDEGRRQHGLTTEERDEPVRTQARDPSAPGRQQAPESAAHGSCGRQARHHRGLARRESRPGEPPNPAEEPPLACPSATGGLALAAAWPQRKTSRPGSCPDREVRLNLVAGAPLRLRPLEVVACNQGHHSSSNDWNSWLASRGTTQGSGRTVELRHRQPRSGRKGRGAPAKSRLRVRRPGPLG
jgi:hypothetical protein